MPKRPHAEMPCGWKMSESDSQESSVLEVKITNHWWMAGIETTGRASANLTWEHECRRPLSFVTVIPDSVLAAGDANSEPSGLPSPVPSLR